MSINTHFRKRTFGVAGTSRDYTNQDLAEVPEDAVEDTDIEGLYFYKNQLTSLPERIGNLSQLRVLDLGSNQLTSLPERIGSLSQLQVLHLDDNRIASLPDSICDLMHLRVLHLNNNRLSVLPERICNLKKLEGLYLSNNQIASLPEGMGNMPKLRVLYLYKNKLAAFPERVCGLSQLRVLHLDDNKIASVPKRICGLPNLKVLHLDNNEISSLSERIGCLSQLKSLDLYNNKLVSLPRTIARLSKIFMLDLRNNPLVEYGEGDSLGWREIASTFGNRAALSADTAPDRVISEQEVYERLAAMPLHWNPARLGKIAMDPVPEHRLEGSEILDIWSSVLSRYEPQRDDGVDMESYLRTVYGVSPSAFRGHHMYGESILDTRDHIEAIFLELRGRADNAACDAEAYVSEMCRAIRQRPFRQMSSFNMVYSALHSRRSTSSLECFVENEIAAVKNIIFEMAVTPSAGRQNEYIQSFWKHKLSDRLGFSVGHQAWMDTFGQDMFRGHIGNALHAFYSKFTPRYVVAQLVNAINSVEARLNDAELFLKRKLECARCAERMFSFWSPEGAEQPVPRRITSEGVEGILVKMGILQRDVQSTECSHT